MKTTLNCFNKLKKYYVIVILLSVIGSVLILLSTNAMSSLTTSITEYGLDGIHSFIYPVLLFFLLYKFCDNVLFKQMKSKIQQYLNKEIYLKLSKTINISDIERMDGYEKGDLYSLIQSDTDSSITFLSDTIIDIIYQLIRIVLVLIYISVLNITLSFVYILMTLISIFIQKKFSIVVTLSNKQTKEKEIEMNTILQNVLDNRIIIKTNQAYEFEKELYQPKVKEYTDAYVNTESKALPFRMTGIFLGLLPILSLCVVGIYMIPRGYVTLGVFLSVEYICNYVVYDQLHFSDFITESAKSIVCVNRIVDFILKNDEIEEKTGKDICLRNVSYHYPNNDTDVLKNITLNIPYGSKVAIVGKSGSGKSTLLKMIAGNIHPSSGECILPNITFIDQFPFLFTDTIRNNVTCWREVNEKEYEDALDGCRVNEFLTDEKDQFVLRKNASNLSGGQKQRIALCRAILNHEHVMLFDESFSGLDSAIALDVLKYTLKSCKEETMIFSIHQMELLPMMDRILVVNEGNIVFDGSYQEYEVCYGKE